MMKNADALPKSIMPGAPARIDMPVLNPEEVKAAAEMIKQGQIDLTEPFSEETKKAIKECFSVETINMLNEHYISESVNEALVDEYDVSGCNRQDLKRFLAKLDSEDISYSFQGSDEILAFDQTELTVTLSKGFAKLGAEEVNEAKNVQTDYTSAKKITT